MLFKEEITRLVLAGSETKEVNRPAKAAQNQLDGNGSSGERSTPTDPLGTRHHWLSKDMPRKLHLNISSTELAKKGACVRMTERTQRIYEGDKVRSLAYGRDGRKTHISGGEGKISKGAVLPDLGRFPER